MNARAIIHLGALGPSPGSGEPAHPPDWLQSPPRPSWSKVKLHRPPASKELACAVARLVPGQQTSPGPCAPPPSSLSRWLRRRPDSRRAEGRGRRRGGVPLRLDPDVPAAAAVAVRTAGTAAALRPDALRTLRVEEGTGPGTRGPVPDSRPCQPKTGSGTTVGVQVGNSMGNSGVRDCASWLSPLPAQHPSPKPQPRRIRSLLCVYSRGFSFSDRSTRISIAHTSAFPNPTRKPTEN
uniref:uncharacterized protein LOC125397917 n=1 Tax=Myodes glareolus TaxID=447135 RepID=UPI002020F7F0|nr:uncharacterized protein LOC125397917 [Myodes glareolus]